jgi:deoxyribose-phosphate aldolase
MVLAVGRLKMGDVQYVEDDIKAVRQVAKNGVILKVIIETAMLTKEEKITACRLAKAAGADFVKTCTGFGGGAATAEDIALMQEIVGPAMGVKKWSRLLKRYRMRRNYSSWMSPLQP